MSDGRLYVVTGAGSGIGRAIALALGRERAKVAILDRDETAARETASLVSAAGGHAAALRCDVADSSSIESARSRIEAQFGGVHVLVNNAAVSRTGLLADLSLADWNALLAVNLTGYFLCAQVFGRAMRERHDGALVHVSSIGAEMPIPGAGAYSVAKAAVAMLSRQLAIEWGPLGVRSNVVHPGFVRTPRTEAIYERGDTMQRRIEAVPSGRIGAAEDVAHAVCFLASREASYVNGAELIVDGGLSCNLLGLIPGAGQVNVKGES